MVIGLFKRVDDAYIGMIESGSGARLAKEVFLVRVADGNAIRKKFQRHGALELGVERLIDDAHPASTELLGDAVVRGGLLDHGAETGRSWILGFSARQVDER